MTGDVVPSRRGFRDRLPRLPRPSRRVTIFGLCALGAVLLIGAAGASYATYDYSERYEGKILPGSTIEGVDVGGLSKKKAVRTIRAVVAPQIHREIEISWRHRSWTTTPKKLGARSNAKSVVEAAFRESKDTSFFEKMQMRLFDHDLSFERPVAITYRRQGARGFIEGVASSLNRKPVDASIDYSTGWVEIAPERSGYEVDVRASHRSLMNALQAGRDQVHLSVNQKNPAVTSDDFDQILLVRIGENRLYLYEDGEITHNWPVATGQPEYMTPTGLYEVTELRYMPTWVNPAPDTWGASMPESIPPGPGNPLGVRAINWSAEAIRFHGTSATYSLGYNASHGCVRMSNEDVVELYDIVEVGTPIVSVVAGELKPLYDSSPDPIPVAENTAPETDGDGDRKDDSRGGSGDGRHSG